MVRTRAPFSPFLLSGTALASFPRRDNPYLILIGLIQFTIRGKASPTKDTNGFRRLEAVPAFSIDGIPSIPKFLTRHVPVGLGLCASTEHECR